MTKKVALAAALLHGPQVLFLDEPFEAIDPVSTRSIEAVLHRPRRRRRERSSSPATFSMSSSGSATGWW